MSSEHSFLLVLSFAVRRTALLINLSEDSRVSRNSGVYGSDEVLNGGKLMTSRFAGGGVSSRYQSLVRSRRRLKYFLKLSLDKLQTLATSISQTVRVEN